MVHILYFLIKIALKISFTQFLIQAKKFSRECFPPPDFASNLYEILQNTEKSCLQKISSFPFFHLIRRCSCDVMLKYILQHHTERHTQRETYCLSLTINLPLLLCDMLSLVLRNFPLSLSFEVFHPHDKNFLFCIQD